MPVRADVCALAGCAGATIAVALAPRALEHALLAATAGTLFEAAPFLLLARLVPARFRGIARLASCGCAGRGEPPGALAPVAFAVCWLSFGPAIAIARAVAAATAAAIRRARARRPARMSSASRASSATPRAPANVASGCALARRSDAPIGAGQVPASARTPHDETFATLWALAASSAATALVAPHLGALATQPVPAAVAGLALGAIVPCATAGVAVAAGCASRDPWLAAGVLATAGIVPRVGLPMPLLRRAAGRTRHDGRFALLLLAVALATLVARGGAGLVNPRLVPLAGPAAVLAAARVLGPRFPATDRAPLVPALMLAALIAGSPEPPYAADETTAVGGFPGERVTFSGTTHADGASTRIVRFSITCCRLDATALAVRLDRRLEVRDGTWLRVSGRFVLRDGRLVVEPDRSTRIAEPADPFVYR